MKYPMKPDDICVPRYNPFRYDLLNRKQYVEILKKMVGSFKGPGVLAVDAPWGMGKTTFIKMWSHHMRNFNFPIVEFNAWENDFSDDPFISLASELTVSLQEYADKSLKKKLEKLKMEAKGFIRQAVPAVLPKFIAEIPRIGFLLGSFVSVLQSYFSKHDRLKSYAEANKVISDFKNTLLDITKTIAQPRKGILQTKKRLPLVVVIDELDRCRPNYAIELLEVAKHLFNVDDIIFVLAINRNQLVNSIEGLYGDNFDGESYLRRFIDVDFYLPEPERENYIGEILSKEYFTRHFEPSGGQVPNVSRELVLRFFSSSVLSIRQIAQGLNRLGLVLNSLGGDHQLYVNTATVFLIFRVINRNLYYQYLEGKVSDLDVANKLFDRLGWERNPVGVTEYNYMANFEAILSVAPWEKELRHLQHTGLEDDVSFIDLLEQPPLIRHYIQQIDRLKSDTNFNNDYIYAVQVVQQVRDLVMDCRRLESVGLGYDKTINHLELWSPEFID